MEMEHTQEHEQQISIRERIGQIISHLRPAKRWQILETYAVHVPPFPEDDQRRTDQGLWSWYENGGSFPGGTCSPVRYTEPHKSRAQEVAATLL